MRHSQYGYLNTSSSAPVFTTLPNAGPFASSGTVNISGLSNLTISSNTNAPLSTQASPLKYDTVTINALWLAGAISGNLALYLWCNKLILNSSMRADGDNGSTGDEFSGGNGGNGASGGGAGGGAPGSCGCGATPDGSPGTSAWTAPSYAFPTGGSTGFTCGGAGPGFGEGGAGCAGGIADPAESGGGGGGGGGLICIVANTITGSASSILSAIGGQAGLTSFQNLFGQSGGGGGVIWVAARVYNGLIQPARVSVLGGGNGSGNGNASIRQIDSGMGLTVKAFNQSWSG